jgi:hypothetical protein
MLNIGGVSFPLYLRQPAVQGLPDKEHCLVLRLSPFRRIAEATWCSDAGWIEEISRGTKDSDQYIVFGQSAGPAGCREPPEKRPGFSVSANRENGSVPPGMRSKR